MNIGAIGWWYYDNQGDLAMLNSLQQALSPHRIVSLNTDLIPNEDTLARLNELDFLLLGGGTLLQGAPLPLFRGFRKWGQRLQTPLGVLGLGVTHVEPAHIPDVQALIEQARFFFVRDEDSRRRLNHELVRVAPDITFAYPLPLSGRPLSNPQAPLCGVNLRDAPGLEIGEWVASLRRLPGRWRGLPLSSYDDWQEHRWLRELDPGCAPGFAPALYTDLDLVIGTAFHSVVFAIQAGVPVIAISYASKVARFMTEQGLDRYALAPDAVGDLPAAYQSLVDNHEALRKEIVARRDRLVQESRAMFDVVRSAIVQAGRPRAVAGEKISILIIDDDSPDALARTLASCRDQSQPETELIVVSSKPPALLRAREKWVAVSPHAGLAAYLNAGLAQATGTHVTWIRAGDHFIADALHLLATQLRNSSASLAYANTYTFERGKISGQQPAHPAYKLKRHNVVTPCFLYDRLLHETIGLYDEHSLLPAYDFWLRVAENERLIPVQTPLMLVLARPTGGEGVASERLVRRRYRATLPPARRLLWRLADSVLADRLLRTARSVMERLRTLYKPETGPAQAGSVSGNTPPGAALADKLR